MKACSISVGWCRNGCLRKCENQNNLLESWIGNYYYFLIFLQDHNGLKITPIIFVSILEFM